MPAAARAEMIFEKAVWSRTASTWNQIHEDPACSGTIKFTQVDRLPGAEDEPPSGDRDHLGIAGEYRFDVGIGVPLRVAIGAAHGGMAYGLLEREEHVPGYVRIGVFLDGDSGCRVRRMDDEQSGFDRRRGRTARDP